MRFYTRTHKHYCGIDLHARSLSSKGVLPSHPFETPRTPPE